MRKQSELKAEIKRMVLKGEDTLKAAKVLLREGFSDKASSQAYYSVFHLLQAVLLTAGLSYSKHSGVLSGFSQHFIKTGVFSKEFAKEIRALREDREIGDYGYIMGINREKAEDDIATAEKIVKAIKIYLADNEWILQPLNR